MTTRAEIREETKRIVADALADLIDWYDPETRPVHCSNCQNTEVYGKPDEPMVRCKYEYRSPKQLVKLLQMHYSIGFRPAKDCPTFVSGSTEGEHWR